MDFLIPNETFTIIANCDLYGRGDTYSCTYQKTLSVRCNNTTCRHVNKIFKDTFFDNTRLKPREKLEIGYMWLLETPATMMYTFFTYSCKTIAAYQLWFRHIVIDVIDPEKQVVGGPGVKVQINELKLAKRKYDQGHSVGDGLWVFGGIDANNNWFTVVVGIK